MPDSAPSPPALILPRFSFERCSNFTLSFGTTNSLGSGRFGHGHRCLGSLPPRSIPWHLRPPPCAFTPSPWQPLGDWDPRPCSCPPRTRPSVPGMDGADRGMSPPERDGDPIPSLGPPGRCAHPCEGRVGCQPVRLSICAAPEGVQTRGQHLSPRSRGVSALFIGGEGLRPLPVALGGWQCGSTSGCPAACTGQRETAFR